VMKYARPLIKIEMANIKDKSELHYLRLNYL